MFLTKRPLLPALAKATPLISEKNIFEGIFW